MKVLAIGSIAKPTSGQDRKAVMPKEVPATLKHYLDGKIEQFWSRQEAPGVIFLINVDSVEQAKAELDTLPLVTGGYDLTQVGSLAPLGLLIQANRAVEAQS